MKYFRFYGTVAGKFINGFETEEIPPPENRIHGWCTDQRKWSLENKITLCVMTTMFIASIGAFIACKDAGPKDEVKFNILFLFALLFLGLFIWVLFKFITRINFIVKSLKMAKDDFASQPSEVTRIEEALL